MKFPSYSSKYHWTGPFTLQIKVRLLSVEFFVSTSSVKSGSISKPRENDTVINNHTLIKVCQLLFKIFLEKLNSLTILNFKIIHDLKSPIYYTLQCNYIFNF